MSFFSDLFEGNFSNLGHDLTAHWKQDLPMELAAAGTALSFGALGPELFGAAGAAEGAAGGEIGGLLGAGEAAAGGGAAGAGAAGTGVSGAGGGALADLIGGSIGSEAGGAAAGVVGGPLGALDATATGAAEGAGGVLGAAEGAGTTGAASAAGGAAEKSFLSRLGEGAIGSLTKNPLGIAAAAGGLGLDILKKPSVSANQQQLQNAAGALGAQGQWLQQYLVNGTLPPGMQAQLDMATKAEKARIIANHAKNGMSTDPATNSALTQELNAVDTNAVAAMADAQMKMMQMGLTETGLSAQLYATLTRLDRQDSSELMKAIANFAAALGGGMGAKKAA